MNKSAQAPRRREPHPIGGAIYQSLGDGLVRVEDQARGKSGVFRYDGVWIEGELTHADPHMLLYIGGPDLPPGRDIFWGFLPPTEEEASALGEALVGQIGSNVAPDLPKTVGGYVGDPGMDTPEGPRSSAYLPLEYLLANDRKPDRIPEVYRKSAPLPGGPRKVPVERYFEKRFHDLEIEHIWKKVWQFACREDDIPEVGDYHLYEVAHLEFLIVRTAADRIQAFSNACLHRGRSLRDCDGKRASEFRCPYHGWTWNIDGSLKHITCEWDFPGVREDVGRLPEAKVATWGGFVFINPDVNAISFEEFAGPEMLDHYRKIKQEGRYKQADVVKVIRANWKVAQEAFLEGWHAQSTHPQVLLMAGDAADARYDIFGNWARLGHAGVAASSPQRGIVLSPEAALAVWRNMADFNREYLRGLIGDEVEQFSDIELTEQSFNNLFPNFSPWGGWGRIVYRFLPNGDNPEECLMRVLLLAPWAEGRPKPAPRPQRTLGPDDSWTLAPELGMLAKIFDQDMLNIPAVQKGLKTKPSRNIWLSAYQESAIRNFHSIYERLMGVTG